MAIEREHVYATQEARDGAASRGFTLSLADWRAIFLAITDTMADDGRRLARTDVTATFVGPVRQGERWSIRIGGRAFDVMYDRVKAVVYRVTDTPRGTAARPKDDPLAPVEPERALEMA